MNNIRVGNLAPNVTEHHILTIFAEYGAVERFKMMTDRWTGLPRGFGFIQMINDADAEKAIVALNGTDIHGKPLKLDPARPQIHRSARPKLDQAL